MAFLTRAHVYLARAQAWASAQLAGRRVQLRLSLRMTLAAVLAYGLSQLLHLPWALWAVLTSVIVTQLSVGKSLIATVDYMIGTLGGGIYSGIVGMIMPHATNLEIAVTLAIAIAPLSLLASSKSRFAAAPFTAVMVLLLPTITHASAAQSAFFRVIEVAVGCMTALAVSFLVLPQRAHSLLYEAVARILAKMADLLPVLVADLRARRPDTPARGLQGDIGVAFRQLATVSAEAARERSAYFNADPDAQPLINLVLRPRHDIVMMGRAATEPLPPDILQRLDGPIEQFGVTARDFLLRSADALIGRGAP
ncbi:MAG: FUSC family protein, partial [Methylovirgula sp.]